MTPEAFCAAIRGELTQPAMDDGWVRGARELCDLYAGAEPARFGLILEQLARGAVGSAFADGARWLLPRWRAANGGSPPEAAD